MSLSDTVYIYWLVSYESLAQRGALLATEIQPSRNASCMNTVENIGGVCVHVYVRVSLCLNITPYRLL